MPPAFDYDSIPPGYYDEIHGRRRGVQSSWHHLKFRFFNEHLRPEDEVLDLGCGPGTFLGHAPPVAQALGLDISSAQIDYATAHYGNERREFVCFDGATVPCADASRDVVTLVEVIEHLPPATVARLFAEAWRVLRPGGRLLVSTPNYGSLWPVLERIVNARAAVTYEEQHINRFRRRRLRAELGALPRAEVSVRAYQFAAPFAAALGWRWAERLYPSDRDLWSHPLGFLLFGAAIKPADAASGTTPECRS